MTRRELLSLLASLPVSGASLPVSADDDRFLDDLSHRSFLYFVEQWHPQTGLFRDRSRTNGDLVRRRENYDIASLAATGFGLTALCIGAERKWISRPVAELRVLTTLKFLAGPARRKNGWLYHFVELGTGERRWACEASSVDTAFALAGVLTARRYFQDNPEIERLAERIYRNIDFQWMLNGDPFLLSHGWFPETGFIRHRWDKYSEQTLLYLLGIGAPRNAIPPAAWYAWTRPFYTLRPYKYLASVGPLFIHQYSHAWVDYRGRRENRTPGVNYFENSINATRAHRDFCMILGRTQFPKSYSADLWGITASDSVRGYRAWGGPPADPRIDGTVVPCGPGGSLMFAPDICVPALRTLERRFGDRIYGRYGFVDAFNPTTDWIDTDVLGIDVGITLLSAENLRSGAVWRWFMANPEIPKAMEEVGLVPEATK
jgi:hypothetical protein